MVGPESEPVEQRYEKLGVQLFEPTPDGFEPLGASEAELQAYGYPRRPDSEAEPRRHQHWERSVSRRSMVEPQFQAPPADLARQSIDSGNWSGRLAFARDGDAVKEVSGQWTVPHAVLPQADSSMYMCATWIGIDGSARLSQPGGLSRMERRVLPGDVEGPHPVGAIPPNERSSDVLQAGTTQAVWWGASATGGLQLSLQTATFAWFQWVPEGPQTITNVPVSPGDLMFCEITALSPTQAAVNLVNLTTNVSTAFMKSAQLSQHLIGECAEWILELPAGTYDGRPIQLPDFGAVYFDHCSALTRKHWSLDSGSGVDVWLSDAGDVGAAPYDLYPSQSFEVHTAWSVGGGA